MPYIGHILTPDGVKADPAKVKAILEMKQPSDVAGVRRILGTVNYLAKFLPHLSQVFEPLRQLTKKDHPFVWNEATDTAFSEIKKLITTPPVLKYYEPNEPLVLQCDASDHGLGAALIQGGNLNLSHSPVAHYHKLNRNMLKLKKSFWQSSVVSNASTSSHMADQSQSSQTTSPWK